MKDLGVLDEQGYVKTDADQKTAVEGLYAAGDVCVKNLRQVVTAVGDGARAATELEKYARAMQEKTGIHPRQPVTRLEKSGETGSRDGEAAAEKRGSFITEEMKGQLEGVFGRMERPLRLKLRLDERPVSSELKAFMEELAALTEKLSVSMEENEKDGSAGGPRPRVSVCLEDGTDTGLAFYGAPGGHEFNSFIIGLYNAAGPGQPLAPRVLERIRRISGPVKMQILVSLTCTMCPELVMAAQRMAAENPRISACVYDLNHFQELREMYQVLSVPCLVINENQIYFGKKNVGQLLEILEKPVV